MGATFQSDRQEAFQEVVARGFNPGDFQIYESKDLSAAGQVAAGRFGKGGLKAYPADSWLDEFLADLHAGVFDPP